MDIGSIAAPGAILTSALLAGLYAQAQVRNQRRIARQNLAFDFVFRSENGEYWVAKDVFRDHVHRETLVDLVKARTASEIADRREVEKFLNWYEIFATAIDRGAVGEPTSFALVAGDVVSTWHEAEAFITALREGSGRTDIYVAFERLARRWERKIAREHRAFSPNRTYRLPEDPDVTFSARR